MTHQNTEALAERFVTDYADSILRLCATYSLSRSDAQDICQNTFVKLLQSNPTFQDGAHEKAWVLRAAINESKNLLKSAFRRHTAPMEIADSLASTPGAEADETLHSAINHLPLKYREAVHLFYLEGYETNEIAKMLGTSPAAIRQRLTRARHQLRIALEDTYEPIY